MRSLAIIALLALLLMPCIAETDSVTTGPYKISFDLGLPKDAYKIEIGDPETKESLSGEISTNYVIKLINKTGLTRTAIITLTSYEKEQVLPTQDEFVSMMKYMLISMDDVYDIEATGREIDGYKGAAGSYILRSSFNEIKMYTAAYLSSSTAFVFIFSAYPWEEGTLQLFKSIHVDEE